MLGARFCVAAQRLAEGGHVASTFFAEACRDTIDAVGKQNRDGLVAVSSAAALPSGPWPPLVQFSQRASMCNIHRSVSCQCCRGFSTSSSSLAEGPQASSQEVSFPSGAAGGIILGPLQTSDDLKSHERVKKIVRARVFDDYYQDGVARTGRKVLARSLKGDYIGDYYMDKITDPLMTNPDGRDEAAIRAERNARGFKRRRPQKQVKQGKKGK